MWDEYVLVNGFFYRRKLMLDGGVEQVEQEIVYCAGKMKRCLDFFLREYDSKSYT